MLQQGLPYKGVVQYLGNSGNIGKPGQAQAPWRALPPARRKKYTDGEFTLAVSAPYVMFIIS
jgi:hypothetical protein